jgi:hypothetical protein
MNAPRMPKLKLYCSNCNARAQAACACNVSYVPAHVAAAMVVAKHPEKSNRAIAAETGISEVSIRRARNSTASNDAVDKRIGLDGKARRLPRHDNPTPAELVHVPPAVELVEKLTPIMDALKKEGKYHETAMSPHRVGALAHELRIVINESLSAISKAKACEVCALEWKIGGTELHKDVIDAVRKTAQAWSDLLKRMLAPLSESEHETVVELLMSPDGIFTGDRLQ